MKTVVKVVAVIGGLLIAGVVAGVVILANLDFNEYKGLIAEKAKEATGRTLTIDGNLDLEISLSPKIAVDGVTFENAAWGSEPNMMTLDTFKAEVELLPLLSSEIRVKRVILSGLNVLAETDAQGTPNWQFAAAEPGEAAESESGDGGDGGPGALPVVEEVQIDNVTLTYKDGVAGKTTSISLEQLTLAAAGKGAPLDLSFAAVFNGERIEGSGTLGSIDTLIGGGAPYPVKLNVSALGTETIVDGTIADVQAAKGLDLQLGVSGANLADTAARGAKLAGQDAAPPLAANPFTLTARVSDPAGGYALSALGLTIGETDLSGTVTAGIGGPRPSVKVDLTSRRIDIDDLIVRAQDGGGEAAASGAGGGASTDESGKKRVFPNDPLPLDGLKAADADVQVKIAELVAAPWRLTDVAVAMTLAGGNLNISSYSAKAFEGTVDGALALDASKATPSLAVDTKVRGLDYGQLSSFAMKQDKPMVHGNVDVDVALKGAGGSVRALMAGLSGDLRAVTQGGKIDSNALNIVSGDVLSALPFMSESKDDKRIECGVVEFNIKQGQAAAKYLLFETGGISVVGEGGMNLAEEELALVFDPRAKKASVASLAEVPVAVKGTFAEPEFVPDATAMAGNLLGSAASIGTAVATGGLSLLVENIAGGAAKRVDETDYCALALAGKPLKPEKTAEADESSGSSGSAAESAAESVGGAVEGAAEGVGGALKSLFGD